MKVFLVGATGVLGAPVVRRLRARGASIVALVRSLERAAPTSGPDVELFEGDLLKETPERLESMLAGCDVAVHLATALRPGSPGLGTTNTNADLRTSGTRRLLDAVLATGLSRYVQQSIALTYIDGGDAWLDEETPFYQPEGSGGAASPVMEMEAMIRELGAGKPDWVILRGGSFVGPGTRQDQVLADLKAGSLLVPGDGANWVSFVHVEDYAEAVVLAIHSGASCATLNITDEPIRNGDYLDRIATMLGLPPPPRDLASALPRSYRCTNAAALKVLGWRPTRTIWPVIEP